MELWPMELWHMRKDVCEDMCGRVCPRVRRHVKPQVEGTKSSATAIISLHFSLIHGQTKTKKNIEAGEDVCTTLRAHVCTRVCTNVCTHVCTHVCTNVCTRVCTNVCTHVCARVCTHAYTLVRTHVYTRVCTHVYVACRDRVRWRRWHRKCALPRRLGHSHFSHFALAVREMLPFRYSRCFQKSTPEPCFRPRRLLIVLASDHYLGWLRRPHRAPFHR